jgi:hypothetical protein
MRLTKRTDYNAGDHIQSIWTPEADPGLEVFTLNGHTAAVTNASSPRFRKIEPRKTIMPRRPSAAFDSARLSSVEESQDLG